MKKETIKKVLEITSKIETLEEELGIFQPTQKAKLTPLTLQYYIGGKSTKYVIIEPSGNVVSGKAWNRDDPQYEYSDWMAKHLQELTRMLIEKYVENINDLKKQLEDLKDE